MIKAIAFLTLINSFGVVWADQTISYVSVPIMEWSSSADKFLLLAPAGDLEVFNQAGDSMWKAAKASNAAKFSPDGEKVAFSTVDGLNVYTFKTNRTILMSAAGPADLITDLQWSPNGQTLSFWKRSATAENETTAELSLMRVGDGNRKLLTSRKQARFNGFPLEPEKQGAILRAQMEQEKLNKTQLSIEK